MLILDGQIESPDIVVDHSKCDLCANCTRTCPMGVLKIVDRKVTRLPNICIGCRNCKVSCSPGAIEVRGQHRIITGAPPIGYAPLKGYPPYAGLSPSKATLVSTRK